MRYNVIRSIFFWPPSIDGSFLLNWGTVHFAVSCADL